LTFFPILALALGLAMDATAVSAARGMAVSRIRASHVLRVALYFGGFQALMPLVGWLIGDRVGPLLQRWDHWIAFVLLAAIGGKMLWEALTGEEEAGTAEETHKRDLELFGWRAMIVLAIATSIDALAVGFTLPMLGAPFVLSLTTIGVTTALSSAAGLFAGRRFGAVLGQRLDMVGGLVLIGMGTKILVEHLLAA
jgi:putative Mn2+ efflux pump MntP